MRERINNFQKNGRRQGRGIKQRGENRTEDSNQGGRRNVSNRKPNNVEKGIQELNRDEIPRMPTAGRRFINR
jgi:hypothetical protein